MTYSKCTEVLCQKDKSGLFSAKNLHVKKFQCNKTHNQYSRANSIFYWIADNNSGV